MLRRWRVVLVVTLMLAAAGIAAVAVWARADLRASLPILEGRHPLPGLAEPVTVTRDALGVPTIRGRSRADVARAAGYLHAQDRFFQMDLARRRAAGELAALVGPRALVLDVETRRHRFRAIAAEAVTLMPADDRRVLDAYTDGVNAGLAALGAPPFEYRFLRQDPRPWRAEDSYLVILSMFITLQDTDGSYESTLSTMADVLPVKMMAFLTPPGTEWDAPIVGPGFEVPPLPGPDVYDLRTRRTGLPPFELDDEVASARLASEAALGSNNWAVSGALTPDGGALVANDMHLAVRVPNTWYRAMFEWPDAADPARLNQLIGLTLPGVPSMVVGSNTHVAWGFTNTYADWGDLVLLDVDRRDPSRYRTPHGWRTFERHAEVIEIAGAAPRTELVRWTIWGPVLGEDWRGRPRAYRWVAHSAEALARTLLPIEQARTLEEAFASASRVNAPGQNMVAAGRDGRIGWSIYGLIPERHGFDGRRPASWADGTRGWTGWLDPASYPRIIDPPGGRLWTANARVVDGEMLARLGDGSYEVGSRATMIRERLQARESFTVPDMLDIQLDARASFLERWRDLLLRSLTPQAIAGDAKRARVRELVERDWTGHASPDSAGYRLTRLFRDELSERVITFVLIECYERDAAFDHTTLRRREGPIWRIVSGQPMHLLDPRYPSWQALIVAAVDAVVEESEENGDLDDGWSAYNVTAYRHPLSATVPLVGRWLDMPRAPLPGDLFTTRMHWGSIAASQRMVVSPGREAEGVMQMPTGQSGHPLSPFYGNSHPAWINGERAPFLPGTPVYELTLSP